MKEKTKTKTKTNQKKNSNQQHQNESYRSCQRENACPAFSLQTTTKQQ